MKKKRRQRVVAVLMTMLMIVGLIPTDFAVTTASAATPYTFNASTDLSPIAAASAANEGVVKTCGTSNYFDVLLSATSKIDASSKTFSDGFVATQRFNPGGVASTTKNSVKFTTTSAVTVNINWVSGGDGRQITILDSTGTAVVTTSETSVKNSLYVSTLQLPAAGTYYLGGDTGSNYIFKVDVTPVDAGTKSTITNVASIITANNVSITWNAANGAGDATTKVEYSTDNGATWNFVGDVKYDVTTISQDLTNLATGTYIYRVTGDFEPVQAAASVDWVQPRKNWSTVAEPSAIVAQSGADIKVTWTMDLSTNGADSLVVDLLDASNAVVDTKTIDKTVGTDQATGDSILAASASGTYTVKLTAKRVDGTGTPDKVVASAATVDYAAALSEPTVVSATGDGTGGVSLVWDAVKEANSYTVSYKLASEADTAYVVASAAIAANSYKVTGLTVDTEYTFKITAVRTTPVFAAATSEVTYNKKVTSTVERVWNTAYVGTQAGNNKANGEVTVNADGSVYMYASDGKFGSSNDGYSFYYTEVDSSAENFVIKATFKVTAIKDNQSGVGLLVADTLGQVGNYELAAETNYYLAGVSKTEFTPVGGVKTTYSCGTNVRKVTGCTDPTGQDALGRVVDMSGAFQTNLEATQTINQANLTAGTCQDTFTVTLTKDNNGYYATMVGSDNVIHMYDPSKLLKQDGEKVYVGLAVSRGTKATFSDISFESRNPASDPVLDPSTWDKEYTPQNLFVYAGATTATSDYTYRYYGNWAGQVTLTDGNGTELFSKYVEAGETITHEMQLAKGTTKLITTIQADSSKVVLASYDPVVIEKSVTYKTYGNQGETIVASPEGTSSGKGTDASPFDIYTAVKYAQPGQVIYLKNGTYNLTSAVTIPYSVSGTKDSMITLMAQDAGQVILDGSQMPESSNSIIVLNGNYWHLYGLDISNSSDNTKGLGVSGNNNIIELCNIHDNGTTGLQISRSGGEPKEWWPANNLVKNCTAYNNCDPLKNDADGFAAKLTVGEGNKFYGCIAYNNIDDGWDLYAKNEIGQGPIGAVVIENSVAYNNGYIPGVDGYGEGNGFKLGGEGLPGAHQLINSVSYNNGGKGITSNNGPDCQVIGCTSYNNNFYYGTGVQTKASSSPNIGLAPLNGSKYTGKTNYVLKNTVSIYTLSNGTADQTTVIGQDALESENNYLVNSAFKSLNSKGAELTTDMFTSIDTLVAPTREANGTINMHGLLAVKASYASLGVGATIVTTGDAAVSVAPVKTTVITGDSTPIYLFFTLSIMSGAALVGLYFYNKKRKFAK